MFSKRIILIFLFYDLIAESSFAANIVGMNEYQIPDNVGVFPDGKLEINFPNVFNSGCADGGGKRIYVDIGNENGVTTDAINQIQSIVMAAQVARKPIKFWYYRDGDVCYGGKVIVSN